MLLRTRVCSEWCGYGHERGRGLRDAQGMRSLGRGKNRCVVDGCHSPSEPVDAGRKRKKREREMVKRERESSTSTQ